MCVQEIASWAVVAILAAQPSSGGGQRASPREFVGPTAVAAPEPVVARALRVETPFGESVLPEPERCPEPESPAEVDPRTPAERAAAELRMMKGARIGFSVLAVLGVGAAMGGLLARPRSEGSPYPVALGLGLGGALVLIGTSGVLGITYALRNRERAQKRSSRARGRGWAAVVSGHMLGVR